MSNPSNYGTVTGRLAADPKAFNNADGSKKVFLTIMADRNYTNSSGDRQADAVPVEAFIRKEVDGLGPYDNVHKGDLVTVTFSVRQDRYTKNGAEVFELKAIADEIVYRESRTVTQNRLAERTAAAQQAPVAAPVAAPAPVATPAPVVATSAVDEQLPFG